jgi:hypothetical protein
MNLLARAWGGTQALTETPTVGAVTRSNFLQKSQEIVRMVYQDVVAVKLF